jgi:hypothetical protein
MNRLSSNLTLFLKFFIPVFWIVFFGAFTTASMMYQFEYFGNIPAKAFRMGVLLFYLSGVVMFVFTLMRLVRVEADEQFLYVTNYFKTARYPYHNIEEVQESDFLGFMLINVVFKEAGIFGKRINFVASKQLYRAFWEQHPDQKAAISTSEPD